jgi:Methyltransferase domain/Protein of unknown function, DUF273
MENNKIIVAQYWLDNLAYSKYTKAINEKYCNEKGYSYFAEEDVSKIRNGMSDRSISWYKPKFILDVLEKFNPEYVLFLDADAIVCNSSYSIQDFIDPEYNIVCTEDHGPSVVNAGVFIFKNTEWTKNFLMKWWEAGESVEDGKYKTTLWLDQTCFGHLLTTSEDSTANIKVISNNVLNGRTYKNPVDNNFIFHAFSYGQTLTRTLDHAYYDIFDIERPKELTLLETSVSYGTDKVYEHNYFKLIYDRVLSPLKYTLSSFVEVGCLNGESLLLWRDYFVNANVIGLDINSENLINALNGKDLSRLAFYNLDQSNEEQLVEMSNNLGSVDVILDDASHKMYDQQITFAKLFRNIKSGGIFIIEDLHTSVEAINPQKSWCNWGDPAKTLTLNMLENFKETGKLESDYLSDEDKAYLEANIASVEIYKQREDWSITSIIVKK